MDNAFAYGRKETGLTARDVEQEIYTNTMQTDRPLLLTVIGEPKNIDIPFR